MSYSSFAGRFLVATPIVGGMPFARSVVFLLEHDESGAIGLIVNQPTDLSVADHLPDLGHAVSDPPVVFLGGPVSSETAVLLGMGQEVDFLRPSALPSIGLIQIDHPPDTLESLRVFAGYSGWDPGQLEAELEEGAWWPVLANIPDIFGHAIDDLWERTVERAPGTIPLYATYPEDPSDN